VSTGTGSLQLDHPPVDEQKPVADDPDGLPTPASVPTGTGINLRSDHPPADEQKPVADDSDALSIPVPVSTGTEIKETARVPEAQRSDSGDTGDEADALNPVNVLTPDGDVSGDKNNNEQSLEDLPPAPSSKYSEVDVEALQERLRLVEQRFSGMPQLVKMLYTC
jgi:hypothetical protein